ncbi:acyltransferase family protein [Serratia nevei]|uniref:acyltransferase family protein n=1 Tax=Serratia nevei TaxID=2703794 RepID=UPI003F77120E
MERNFILADNMNRDLPQQKASSGVPGRLEYVDSIRGLAAIGVVIAHFIVPLYLSSSVIFHDFIDIGKIGVVLFFIISGFIIPFSFKEKNGGVKAFLISRFFRLYPAYWVSLFIFLVVSYFVGTAYPTHQILSNITMFQSAFGVRDIVGVYWTLFIELVFYALCVFLFVMGILNNLRTNFYLSLIMLGFALLLGGVRYFSGISLPVALPLALSLMMFGGMWRAYILHGDYYAKKLCGRYILVYVFMIPVICSFAYGGLFGNGIRYIITYLLSVVLFFIFTTKVRLQNRFFVFLGTISYSVYLIHPSILVLFEHFSDTLDSNWKLFWAIMGVIVTIPISHVIYKFVEEPAVAFGRKMKNHIVSG